MKHDDLACTRLAKCGSSKVKKRPISASSAQHASLAWEMGTKQLRLRERFPTNDAVHVHAEVCFIEQV